MENLFSDKEILSKAVADQFVELASQAIEEKGRFDVVLTGGNSPKLAYQLLAQPPYIEEVDWTKVYIFWGDERWVDFEDERNNARMAYQMLINKVEIPRENVFRIEKGSGLESAAQAYDTILRDHFEGQLPRFDLMHLGVGGDGHVASLFPGNEVDLNEQEKWVIATENPELNEPRISLTFPLINNSRQISFIAYGEAKSKTIAEIIRKRPPELPASRVEPTNGKASWYLDYSAARDL